MARPLVLAVCLVLGSTGVAVAGGKTSKVTIETEPPGAKVYLNVKEDGEVCTTPCTIDAPIGETPIIVEAENRQPIIENLVVPRKTAKPIRVSYKLKPAVGTLIVAGGDGGSITIDEQPHGTAPHRFEDVIAGAHHVVVQKDGVKLYDGFVEVEIGEEATASAKLPPAEPAAAADPAPSIAVARLGPPSRRPPQVAITAVSDIGFRQFTFTNESTPLRRTQRDDREAGQVLTGAIIELWPTTLAGVGSLSGLSLYGRFEVGVNPQRVQINGSGAAMATSLTTSWRQFELSAHQRWTIADVGTIEVGAGYVVDRYQFSSSDTDQQDSNLGIVPDAAYKSVRIGGRGSLLFDRFEPYISAENRLVISGGVLESRYRQGGSANGVHGTAGVAVHLGSFELRAEGALNVYSWTFHPAPADADQATSGTDLVEQIGFAVGYTY